MRWRRRLGTPVPPIIRDNIHSIAQLDAEVLRHRSLLDRVSDAISNFAGSIGFIFAHGVVLAAWVIANSYLMPRGAFDPYPYVFLNLVLAIEAVLLGTFVLMSQNRQNRQADQRAHLDLLVGLLAEREATKALHLLRRICQHLGLEDAAEDKELLQMLERTQVKVLAHELRKAREEGPPNKA